MLVTWLENIAPREQERLRDRQPERLGGRCLPGGLCCNLTFPFLAAVRRRPAPSALRNVKSMHAVMSGRRTAGGQRGARSASTAARSKSSGPGFAALTELGGDGCGRLARQVGHEPDVDQRRDAQVCPKIGRASCRERV